MIPATIARALIKSGAVILGFWAIGRWFGRQFRRKDPYNR